MATNPIEAGFVPANTDANPWYDKIDHLLTLYHRNLATLHEPEPGSIKDIATRAVHMALASQLAEMGVQVSGGIGHA